MAARSRTDLPLVVLGLLGWVAGGLFATLPPLNTVETETQTPNGRATVRVVNPAAAGVACGLGIGGGLCFLGAALAARRDGPIA
jgi:hypothetical protein